jgi:hypothetical protein
MRRGLHGNGSKNSNERVMWRSAMLLARRNIFPLRRSVSRTACGVLSQISCAPRMRTATYSRD